MSLDKLTGRICNALTRTTRLALASSFLGGCAIAPVQSVSDVAWAAKMRAQIDTTAILSTTTRGRQAEAYLVQNSVLLLRSHTAADLANNSPKMAVSECFMDKIRSKDGDEVDQVYVANAHCLDDSMPEFVKVVGSTKQGDFWVYDLRPTQVAMLNRKEDCKIHPKFKINKSEAANQYDLAICRPNSLQGRNILPKTQGLLLDPQPAWYGERMTYLTGEIVNASTHPVYRVRWAQTDVIGSIADQTNGLITGFMGGGSHASGESGKVATHIEIRNDNLIVDARGIFKQSGSRYPLATFESGSDLAEFVISQREWLRQGVWRDPDKTIQLNW